MFNLAEAHRWAATFDDSVKAAAVRTAADKGSASAMYAIGIMYSRGEGMTPDDNIARQWFVAGANAGNAEAMSWVGMFASAGRGGAPVDNTAGLMWNQRAAALGVNYAMANIAGHVLLRHRSCHRTTPPPSSGTKRPPTRASSAA
ncbi:MAG: hypothetical protein WDN06_06905 [Asticcacaulis sp.]